MKIQFGLSPLKTLSWDNGNNVTFLLFKYLSKQRLINP